jgi:hypothetical protein
MIFLFPTLFFIFNQGQKYYVNENFQQHYRTRYLRACSPVPQPTAPPSMAKLTHEVDSGLSVFGCSTEGLFGKHCKLYPTCFETQVVTARSIVLYEVFV